MVQIFIMLQLIAKPAVHSSKQHEILIKEAKKHNVLVVVEFHKRFDPIYGKKQQFILGFVDNLNSNKLMLVKELES